MPKPVYLGTAQWAAKYGATNTLGAPSTTEALWMLNGPWHGLDTAPTYGNAEQRIGFLSHLPVQTKIACAGLSTGDMGVALKASLRRMRRSRVHTLLVHDWADLTVHERAKATAFLTFVRLYGVAQRVGVSIYEPRDLHPVPDVDVIQLPASVMDQSVIDSPEVAKARSLGITIQARSIYLQGVALEHHALRTCVSYVKQHPAIDEVVVGCANVEQATAFWAAWESDPVQMDWASLAVTDRRVTDPRGWL